MEGEADHNSLHWVPYLSAFFFFYSLQQIVVELGTSLNGYNI